MADNSKRDILKRIKERKYLNKDFDGFKRDLLDYARTYYNDANRDFSEASFGGMLLDFASYVGDVSSFYLDHQYQETFTDSAVENRNIQRLLEKDGVKIVGASPAVLNATFFIEVPAISDPNPRPNPAALPILQAGTVIRSNNGVEFELVEDVDFRETNPNGVLLAEVSIGQLNSSNIPTTFFLKRKEICISGQRASDSFSVGSFEPFKTFTLSKENVTEIISVTDSLGNVYYEVDALNEDTVYKAVTNIASDFADVPDNLIPIPAPYRFISKMNLQTRLTTLTFGGGSAETLNDDIIPDPSEFAVPLYGKRTFSRFSINPGNLLKTTTLGILAPNTTVTVTYRHGGGLNHNIPRKSVSGVVQTRITFPGSPDPATAQFVRSSLDASNDEKAGGGEDAPSIDDLKLRAPSVKASQGRIVSKPDLLARLYTMPSNFGRVFRASIRSNPDNPMASQLFVVSRDLNGQLTISPDALKKNIRTFLSTYRIISDAIDILDAQIINIGVDFSIVVDPRENKQIVVQNVVKKLSAFFQQKNFDIDQPLVLSDLHNIIFNNPGVISVDTINVKNINTSVGQRTYSNVQFNVEANTSKGIVIGPPGSIFEVKYKNFDLQGTAV